ncbi:MAG: TIGR02206 family membrane protein [Candidatus Izemoplasmatales bacterium]
MRDFFSATTGIPFEAFGIYHLIVLAIVAVSVLGLYLARERLRRSPRERIFRIVLGCVGIASEVSLHLWQIMNGIWTFADSAPIAVCFFSLALGVFVMFTKSRPVFEIAYFWAIGGVASILFPDIPYGPDRFRFYEYLIGHLSFFLMFMYMLFVHGYRPTLRSFAKSALILLGITLFVVYPIDLLTGANFLFLLDPAGTPFELLLPLTGEAFYIPGVILTAAIVMGLWGLPALERGKRGGKDRISA